MANKSTIMDRAKTAIIIRHPFFASILLKRDLEPTDRIPTAGINKSGRIYYNPEFVEGLSVDQGVFLLAHECMHWMMETFPRQGNRDMQGWNYATDAVNNEILVEAGVGEFIDGGVRWLGAQDMTAEAVYEQLPRDENGKPQVGEIGGTGEDLEDSGEPLSPAEAKEIQSQVKVEIAQAAETAKRMGAMPGNLQRIVDEILHPKTPWYTILERFMTDRVKTDYSWARPNRRHIANDIYLPSLDGTGLDEAVVVVDTSGSISQKELAAFQGHLNVILEACRPKALHVVYVDRNVDENNVETYTSEQLPVQLSASGGGGTDMRVGLGYADEHWPEAACCVLLTDAFTPWPDSMRIPLIVASTTDRAAPDHLGPTVFVEED